MIIRISAENVVIWFYFVFYIIDIMKIDDYYNNGERINPSNFMFKYKIKTAPIKKSRLRAWRKLMRLL